MRMLIVDDETLIAQGIQYVVKKLGTEFNQIDVAFSGKEALGKLSSQPYDLLLTDVSMQGMSGLELISEVKQLGLCSNFCILSGYAEFEYARKAVDLGVFQYLLKPVDKEKLYKLLLQIAQKVRAEQDNKRRDTENRIGEVLFRGSIEEELTLLNGMSLLTTVVIGDPVKGIGFSHMDFREFYKQGIAEYIIHIHHFPAVIFISKTVRKTELLNELAKKCPNSNIGITTGTITSAAELCRHFADAGQAALYARYIFEHPIEEAENLLPYPMPNSTNFKSELQRRYNLSIPENQLVLFQISLHNLLGKNSMELAIDSSNEYVKQMLNLVRNHFSEELTLSDIAEAIGLNSEYAGRLFKSETGVSFQEFLNRHRIFHILQCMMQNPMLSFEQLAPCMGFPNMRSFYRVFKRIMKMTPGDYKKAYIHANKKEPTIS